MVIICMIKDVGDDFDVIYGVIVFVELMLLIEFGIIFKVVKGVGIVIWNGLLLDVGEFVINLVLCKMMIDYLQLLVDFY